MNFRPGSPSSWHQPISPLPWPLASTAQVQNGPDQRCEPAHPCTEKPRDQLVGTCRNGGIPKWMVYKGKSNLDLNGDFLKWSRDGKPGCALVDMLPFQHRQKQNHFMSWSWQYSLGQLWLGPKSVKLKATVDDDMFVFFLHFSFHRTYCIILQRIVNYTVTCVSWVAIWLKQSEGLDGF